MAQLQSLMDDGDGSKRWALVEALYAKALEGDMQAMRLILDRTDPAPRHDITINNNMPSATDGVLDALMRLRAKVANGKNGKR
jgi:hypothetical protein